MAPIFYLFGGAASEFYIEHQDNLSAKELAEAISEMDFATSVFDQNSHPSELLVEYDGWEDFAEITEELYTLLQQDDNAAFEVFEILKKEYFDSDVVSGEFIHSMTISHTFTRDQVIKGVQMFLDWDESSEKFDVEKGDPAWIIKEINS